GEERVGNVLDIMRAGIDSGLLGLGKRSVQDLAPEDLLIPANFRRQAGVA
ncbi:MAG: alpha-hydroxy-acid oxidizing enzyme, partial [Marmoricola sp.]|nr:alpha-hydroxy-acid oxidizing enzyme [Marmoricola sp.]